MSITTSGYEKAFIHQMAESVAARRILEIGVFKGQTTAVLADVAAQHQGKVVAIDPMRWASKPASLGERIDTWLHPFSYESAFWKNVGRRSAQVRLFRALSTDPALLENPDPLLKQFDLVFIDGEHTRQGVLADLRNWGCRVRTGGLILMHDVRSRFPEVEAVFDQFARHPALRATWPRRGSVGMFEVLRPFDPRNFSLSPSGRRAPAVGEVPRSERSRGRTGGRCGGRKAPEVGEVQLPHHSDPAQWSDGSASCAAVDALAELGCLAGDPHRMKPTSAAMKTAPARASSSVSRGFSRDTKSCTKSTARISTSRPISFDFS